jgi:hypothetical protein
MITNKTMTTYGSEGLRFDSSWLHFPSLYKPASSLLLRAFEKMRVNDVIGCFAMFIASQLTPKLSPFKVVPAI